MREKSGYRDNLEQLNSYFPEMELLSVSDVARYAGKDRRTVRKLFLFTNGYISKVEVARKLAN